MIRKIDTYKLRWDEWFNLVQTRLMPSFTPVGFQKVSGGREDGADRQRL